MPLSDAPDLRSLPTEASNEATKDLSRLPTEAALRLMNLEDQKVALAVEDVVSDVAEAVDAIAQRLEKGGRLIYIGAGTSGRLGVVDASECPPTFGVSPKLVQGVIAGGPDAVFRSKEGAEDIPEDGAKALQALGLTANDAVVGLAASGRTPYVIGALDYAGSIGALTAAVTVNPYAPLREKVEHFIAPFVGPEVITGSTRLKAGTAQKLVLNMISTGVMLRLGYVDGNRMTHLKLSCGKLVDRGRRLVIEETGVDEATAVRALEENDHEVWRAVAAIKAGKSTPA